MRILKLLAIFALTAISNLVFAGYWRVDLTVVSDQTWSGPISDGAGHGARSLHTEQSSSAHNSTGFEIGTGGGWDGMGSGTLSVSQTSKLNGKIVWVSDTPLEKLPDTVTLEFSYFDGGSWFKNCALYLVHTTSPDEDIKGMGSVHYSLHGMPAGDASSAEAQIGFFLDTKIYISGIIHDSLAPVTIDVNGRTEIDLPEIEFSGDASVGAYRVINQQNLGNSAGTVFSGSWRATSKPNPRVINDPSVIATSPSQLSIVANNTNGKVGEALEIKPSVRFLAKHRLHFSASLATHYRVHLWNDGQHTFVDVPNPDYNATTVEVEGPETNITKASEYAIQPIIKYGGAASDDIYGEIGSRTAVPAQEGLDKYILRMSPSDPHAFDQSPELDEPESVGGDAFRLIPQKSGVQSLTFDAVTLDQAYTASKSITINVSPADPLVIDTPLLPAASPGRHYEMQLQASGGVPPYTWYVEENNLPLGFNLDASGLLSGESRYYDLSQSTLRLRVRDAVGAVVYRDFQNPAIYVDPDLLTDQESEIAFDFWGPILGIIAPPFSNQVGGGGSMMAEPAPRVTGGQGKWTAVKTGVLVTDKAGAQTEYLGSMLEHYLTGKGGVVCKSKGGNVAWFHYWGEADPGKMGRFERRVTVNCEIQLQPNRIRYVSSSDPAIKLKYQNAAAATGGEFVDLDAKWNNVVEDLRSFHEQLLQEAQNAGRMDAAAVARQRALWEQSHVGNTKAFDLHKRTLNDWMSRHTENSLIKQGEVIYHDTNLSQVNNVFKNGSHIVEGLEGRSRVLYKSLLQAIREAEQLLDDVATITGRTRAGQGFLDVASKAERAAAEEGMIAKGFNPKNVFTLKLSPKAAAALRVGGKALIVIGIATDLVEIYTAENKVKTIVKVVGGWGGATAGAALTGVALSWFEFAPGPGTIAHGVCTLIGGGIGYFVGSKVAVKVYEMIFERVPPGQTTLDKLRGG